MAASDPALYAFELTFKTLNDSKTPVSRSKIQKITELAVKAQKFYKHVVMNVESFIKKCSPKHKLPGVYVIDSIIRVSQKHGKEKDVFGPRFAKNLGVTFSNSSKCAEEDKLKIFRCFKLWKEGNFFPEEIISTIAEKISKLESFEDGSKNAIKQGGENKVVSEENGSRSAKSSSSKEKDEILVTKNMQEKTIERENCKAFSCEKEKVRFDKRLLDFDYEDSDEENGLDRSSAKRSKRKAPTEKEADDEADFLQIGKDGKPVFSVDKIMSGLRQSRQPLPVEQPSPPQTPVPMDIVSLPPAPLEVDSTSTSEPSSTDMFAKLDEEFAQKAAILLKSCTIWIGHLRKGITETELRDELSRYSTIRTLDLIPSRGCAYIAYEKRRHAEDVLEYRRSLYKVFGDKTKVSWGLGKGIKAGHKQWNWDVDTGECRIKLSELPASLKGLQEGSELVEDSVPNFLKSRFADAEKEEESLPKAIVTEPKPSVPTSPAPSSSWQTSATLGFVVPETRWGPAVTEKVTSQASAPTRHPVLENSEDIHPPPYPTFFSVPPPAGPHSNEPGPQNSNVIPTITTQTSWSDPVEPQKSVPATELLAESFASMRNNVNATTFPSNPLFSKPPPALGMLMNQAPPGSSQHGGTVLDPNTTSHFYNNLPGNTFSAAPNVRPPFPGAPSFPPPRFPGGSTMERGNLLPTGPANLLPLLQTLANRLPLRPGGQVNQLSLLNQSNIQGALMGLREKYGQQNRLPMPPQAGNQGTSWHSGPPQPQRANGNFQQHHNHGQRRNDFHHSNDQNHNDGGRQFNGRRPAPYHRNQR